MEIDGETMEIVTDFIFLGSKITAESDCSHEIKRRLLPWKISYDKHSVLKSRYHFADRSPYNQSYGFFSCHVWMCELDHKEGCMPKNWCFWTVVMEETLESPLDCKEIKPVNPKGNWPWIFIKRTDAEAEVPILWLPDAKSQLIENDLDAGKDWRQKREGGGRREIVK